jgi:hypothetical protein
MKEEYSVPKRMLFSMQTVKFIAELHFYGIQFTAVNWFGFCLTDCKHKFEIKSCNANKICYEKLQNSWTWRSQQSIVWSPPTERKKEINKFLIQIHSTCWKIVSHYPAKNVDDYYTLSKLVLSPLSKCVDRLKRYLGFNWFFASKLALNL